MYTISTYYGYEKRTSLLTYMKKLPLHVHADVVQTNPKVHDMRTVVQDGRGMLYPKACVLLLQLLRTW